MPVVDLTVLPSGKTYADTYGKWLEIFRWAAEDEVSLEILQPPASWVPLLLYFGARVQGCGRKKFECDEWIADPFKSYEAARRIGRQREYVEHICALRPELVDALWKSDQQWWVKRRDHTDQKSFVVANYSALHRPELLKFMTAVDRYTKPDDVKNAVVTNCSADKPYPAELHRGIQKQLPSKGWHMVIATGVLGVVPQELWSEMPMYDSGLPNFWRCMTRWERYLGRTHYDRIIVYTEFYSRSVARALSRVTDETMVSWVTPCGPHKDYLDLASSKWLNLLEREVLS